MTDSISPDSFPAAFERSLRLSPYARRLAAARPRLVQALAASGAAPLSRADLDAAVAAVPEGDPAALGAALRELRSRVMLTLIHRDLAGLANLDEVVSTVTALAEVAIGSAVRAAHAEQAALHGEPARGERLLVVGMGKLGGGELNVSSDVDLIFLHAAEGDTDGARPLSHHEFFTRVGKRAIGLLADVTGDGYVFRVDMRLRPFGDSGPLVSSFAALENYFIGQARPWERYAWLKGRVLNGPGEEVAAIVVPFVYRRYLDYGLLESLRDLHGRIQTEAGRRGRTDDIKVGAGGIRECEFAVQLFQLVRGGRDPGLQLASTRAALAAVGNRGLLPPERVAALRLAYEFLRRLEHRLQYYEDQQTQALPVEPTHREAIAEAMEFGTWDSLVAELDRHRAGVQEAFNALFERRTHGGASALLSRLTDPQATPDEEGLVEDLRATGLADPAPVAARLAAFVRSRRYRALSGASRTRVDRLLPAAMEAAVREDTGPDTATRLLDLIEAIDRRESYLALLDEYPVVLARATRLAAKSRWAARLLARHPILLDELTRSTASFTATDWTEERRLLVHECAAQGDDTEQLMDQLRHFKQRHVLRLAIADLEGELPVMALSDELSALADLLLDVVLGFAARAVFGGDGIEPPPGFAVIGYGKLGGKELGYGSDLDIVFLYDESRKDDAERLARVAQRVNTWLTSHTSAGVLYETDLRLRPDGASGLMVSSFPAFRDYQVKRAWTWEHQALTRARFCAGDAALGLRFEALRREVLAAPRDTPKLREEILAMRDKMRAEVKADARDLKHTPGGVVDLEFAVQAMVLGESGRHPSLLDNKGNNTLLKRAGDLGIVPVPVAVAAADAYLALRARTHAASLNDEEHTLLADGELAAEREAVNELWKAVFAKKGTDPIS
ncbi:MAG: bifunctional [glutamate--ammonia ligase]-adenylyl-L-tyrosine phosphorylase/[glutamate--ammonia-ligase] adenylyltransferase [Betaproteobacteria bacterium]|nr:bifunctional [glutamate--ammonia ligase]-adenylyl-L-tyrosine phosphorylase/[glutamate--ammonia-ligase] adenylyltransferase [Betaproteobacteria bacterium]